MKTKMQRTIFQRKMAAGETMDFSANAIYLQHVMERCAALARANTKEAADLSMKMSKSHEPSLSFL